MIWIVDGQSFGKRFEVKNPVPHPESPLLKDIVFFEEKPWRFWRRSENDPESRLVKGHDIEEIKKDIMNDFRGHYFLIWKNPRKTWMKASRPVFIDFGKEELYRLVRYTLSGQWCVRITTKRKLIEENGGTYSFAPG